MMNKHFLIVCACALVVATACDMGARYRKDTVWELYDVRTPLPAGSQVRSRAAQQDPSNSVPMYRDNDAYYTAPDTSFGVCAQDDLASFSCD